MRKTVKKRSNHGLNFGFKSSISGTETLQNCARIRFRNRRDGRTRSSSTVYSTFEPSNSSSATYTDNLILRREAGGMPSSLLSLISHVSSHLHVHLRGRDSFGCPSTRGRDSSGCPSTTRARQLRLPLHIEGVTASAAPPHRGRDSFGCPSTSRV